MNNLSPAELNLAIAKLLWPESEGYEHSLDENGCADAESETRFEWFAFDDWECLMPLVVSHGIDLMHDAGDWVASRIAHHYYASKSNISVTNDDPQRALAECLLAVLMNKGGADGQRRNNK